MTPAQQRLATRHPAIAEADQRLINNIEFAIGDRLPEIQLQRAQGVHAGTHAGLEEAIGPAPVGLGLVHRQIGVLEQLIEVRTVLRRPRDPDAGVRRQMVGVAGMLRAIVADRGDVNSRRRRDKMRRLAGKDDPRFHRNAPVQILDVVVHEPDASGRDQMADGLG